MPAPYRPTQWNNPLGPQTVALHFPGQPAVAQYAASGITATLPQNPTAYVFDAVLRNDHEQRAAITSHPVQTGASISDHAYLEPARLTLEIGISDTMDAFAPGLWVGAPTKSISAYQVLLSMCFARIPLTINTKLRTYENMVIEQVAAEDTVETIAALKARIAFRQIFVASTQAVADSARPDATIQTSVGTVNPTPPTEVQTSQHEVTNITGVLPMGSTLFPEGPAPYVQGAGQWSSVNLNTLGLLP